MRAALEIEPDPELELPGGRLLHVRELRPIEMEGIAQEEELEAETVGGPAVHQPEAADRLAEDLIVHEGKAGLAGRELPVFALEVASPGPEEEGAPDGSQHADRGGRQVDEGEAELHVPEEAGVAGEAQVVVAPELHVAAEVEVGGVVAARVEAAQAEGLPADGRLRIRVLELLLELQDPGGDGDPPELVQRVYADELGARVTLGGDGPLAEESGLQAIG